MSDDKRLTWDANVLTTQYSDKKQCYQLSEQQAMALLLATRQMAWGTRWTGASDEFISAFTGDIAFQLMSPQKCSTGGGIPVDFGLGDCLSAYDCDGDGLVDTYIFEECERVIHVYFNSCGCDCGGAAIGGASPDGISPYAPPSDPTTGGIPGDTPSTCDFLTGGVEYVADQAAEFFLSLENAVTVFGEQGIDKIVDALIGDFPILGNAGAVLVDWVSDVVEQGAQFIRQMFQDAQFIESMRIAFVQAHGERADISNLTRDDFRAWGNKLPLTFVAGVNAVVLPRLAFQLFWRFLNVSALNTRLATVRGTGNSALCEFIYQEAGVAPPVGNEVPSGALPPPVIAGAYSLEQITGTFTLFSGIPYSAPFNTGDLETVGFMIRFTSGTAGQSPVSPTVALEINESSTPYLLGASTAAARAVEMFTDNFTFVDIIAISPSSVRSNIAASPNQPSAFVVPAGNTKSYDINLLNDAGGNASVNLAPNTDFTLDFSADRILTIESVWMIQLAS